MVAFVIVPALVWVYIGTSVDVNKSSQIGMYQKCQDKVIVAYM